MRFVPCCLLLLAALPLPAQDPAWRLPARGAVEYRRDFAAGSGVAATKEAARKVEALGEVPSGLMPELVMPPWLCQGELAADQRSVGDEPRDLRDLMRAVAFDLRLGSRTKLRYLRLLPFGDFVLTGRVDAPGPEGRQVFTLSLATDAPDARPGESKADLSLFVRPLCKREASGSLTVTRHWDADAGVVKSFTAELTLVFAEDKSHWRKLVVHDAWDLVAVHDNQDAWFRGAVADAIVRGAKWVHQDLGDAPRNEWKDAEADRSYGAGRIALALLTLLHAEVPPDDPVVVAGFDELRRRVMVDTYSIGIALMALAALYAPQNEAEQLRNGVIATPRPRELTAEDRDAAQRWLARLRQNVDIRCDPGYRLRFNYVAEPRYDQSVNQYGLLGLWSAKLCQIDVPSSLWRAAANHLLETQCDDNGRSLRLTLTTHRDLARGEAGNRTRGGSGLVPTRGFAYQDPDRPPYGSMACAGISGLVLARAGMQGSGLAKADVMPKVDAAIQAGFAWLAAEFHVRSNPGFVEKSAEHWYYYLYGLERTCELAGVALLHERDWYFEGALQLLAMQNQEGTFRGENAGVQIVEPTCFAILFLKKATLPAVTGG